jgi:hypothetical protein
LAGQALMSIAAQSTSLGQQLPTAPQVQCHMDRRGIPPPRSGFSSCSWLPLNGFPSDAAARIDVVLTSSRTGLAQHGQCFWVRPSCIDLFIPWPVLVSYVLPYQKTRPHLLLLLWQRSRLQQSSGQRRNLRELSGSGCWILYLQFNFSFLYWHVLTTSFQYVVQLLLPWPKKHSALSGTWRCISMYSE